jgi:hypothetical protein
MDRCWFILLFGYCLLCDDSLGRRTEVGLVCGLDNSLSIEVVGKETVVGLDFGLHNAVYVVEVWEEDRDWISCGLDIASCVVIDLEDGQGLLM